MKALLFIMIFTFPLMAVCQDQIVTTSDGRKVILKDDGTWDFHNVEQSAGGGNKSNTTDCIYITNEKDEFTGKLKKYLKPHKVAKKFAYRFFIELRRFEDNYLLKTNFEGDIGCVTSKSELLIKLSDGTVITYNNFGDIDCKSNASMFFNINDENLTKLNSIPIDKIRVNGSKGYMDLEVVDSRFFIDNLKCIIN